MSNATMGSAKSKDIPVPPPLPPPPLQKMSKESQPSQPKLKTTSAGVLKKKSPAQIRSKNASNKSSSSATQQSKSQMGSKQTLVVNRIASQTSVPESVVSLVPDEEEAEPEVVVPQRSKSRKKKEEQESVVDIIRNEVVFFNEEECTDPDDEFSFPCCLQPNSPRFPPNPRPFREWDPSYLPSSTSLHSSIGRNCRRCGKPVYLAELYLSSRGAYHSECYKCCLCGKSLDSWSVAEYKGEVFCKGCYRRNFGTHGCGFGVGAGQIASPGSTVVEPSTQDNLCPSKNSPTKLS